MLCWLAFAIFVVTNLVSLGLFIHGSSPRGLSRGLSFFVVDQVVIPALLAMAPLACLYADARAQRFMALALGFLGLLPFLSIDRPAEQPFEALAPLLVSYLTVALAVTGLLVSAGLMTRNRKAPDGLAGSAGAELPNRQGGTPEVSRGVARGNPPLGAALCWLALAHSLGLGSMAFAFEWINQRPSALVWVISSQPTLTCSLLAMAPWVCTFSGPRARRVLGALLALGALMMLPGIWWFGPRRAARSDCVVSERRRAALGGCRCATESRVTRAYKNSFVELSYRRQSTESQPETGSFRRAPLLTSA